MSRLSARSRRPSTTIGTTTAGTISSTNPVSLPEVISSIAMPPNSISRLRNATETDEPITDRISVVSVVSRETISPLIIRSKKAGERPIRRSNIARRISATTRSPNRVTR